jgi:hypothetical protein
VPSSAVSPTTTPSNFVHSLKLFDIISDLGDDGDLVGRRASSGRLGLFVLAPGHEPLKAHIHVHWSCAARPAERSKAEGGVVGGNGIGGKPWTIVINSLDANGKHAGAFGLHGGGQSR